MHEFELGVWKSIFTHLIRILYAAASGGQLVTMLDERYSISSSHCMLKPSVSSRYRQVPPFGSTVRRFASNASEMKKLAARDFEDLLQVCRSL
jgi:hypothetical protein